MARSTYLGTASDMLLIKRGSSLGVATKDGVLRFWDAETGGTRHTDLLLNGVAVTEVPVPAGTLIAPAVQLPDGVDGGAWVEWVLDGETAADSREFVTPSRPLQEAKAHTDAAVAGIVIPDPTPASIGAETPAGAQAKADAAETAATAAAQALVDALKANAPAAYDTLVEIATKLNADDDVTAQLLADVDDKVDAADLDTLTATEIQTEGSETKAALSASYVARAVPFGTPLLAPSGMPVTVQVAASTGGLSWDGTGGVTTSLATLTGSTLQSYFAAPVTANSTWNATPIVYPDFGTQYTPPWNVLGFTTNSTRIRLTGRFDTGRGLGPLVLVDGQPINSNFNAPSLTYSGSQGGILLTFPDTSTRTVEVISTWAFNKFIADAGSTTTAYKRSGPAVAILGDSWIEGTSQGGAGTIPAWISAATRWRVLGNGQGGTGYVADPDGAGSKGTYGSRVAGLVASLPDVLVVFGSTNDPNDASVQAAAASLFDAVATASPTTKIIVLGPQIASAGQAANLARLQAAAVGKANVLTVVDPTAWQNAATTGPSDAAHPSPLGVQWFARKIIDTVRTQMLAAGSTAY